MFINFGHKRVKCNNIHTSYKEYSLISLAFFPEREMVVATEAVVESMVSDVGDGVAAGVKTEDGLERYSGWLARDLC